MLPLIALATAAAAPVHGTAALPVCKVEQLSLGFDAQGGAFNGMSHSGALLVIRNMGPKSCRMDGLPRLTFRDAKGKPLAIARTVPRGMHPGPAIAPVGVAAGAELTAPLRWVSGEVYDKSICVEPAFAAVAIGGRSIQTAFTGRLCGQTGTSIGFEQPVLRPDPRL